MSTYIYLQCTEHTPAITSPGESGQHTYDLPEIRRDIMERDFLVRALSLGLIPDSGHFRGNTIQFLAEHPDCRIRIIDEYGGHYSLMSESQDPDGGAADDAFHSSISDWGGGS